MHEGTNKVHKFKKFNVLTLLLNDVPVHSQMKRQQI